MSLDPSTPPASLAKVRLFAALRAYASRHQKQTFFLFIFLSMYGCWEIVIPSGSWRYRLTIVVDDNGTQHTGSGVIQANVAGTTRAIQEIIHSQYRARGEAVAVDLGEKGVLFALLRGSRTYDAVSIVWTLFPPPRNADIATFEGIRYYEKLEGKRDIPFDNLPMLVRFRDINDPMTLEKVDPQNLEASFGAGVKIVSATIEMTDDAVTRGIEKKLPWLEKVKWHYLDGKSISRGAPLGLHGGDFER